MRKIIAVLVVFVFAAGLLLVFNDEAYARRKKKDKKEAKTEEVVPAADEPKLIYAFKTDEEMTEFEQLYISKQQSFARISVLQMYFSMEQSSITEIDRQMEEKFGFTMAADKMYDLNRDTKEIREVGTVPSPAPAE